MTPAEVSQLLTIAALVDNRIVGRETVQVWHEAIGHLGYSDCLEALNLFRRESDKYLQPANIVNYVKRIREERLARIPIEHKEAKTPFPRNLDAWTAAWNDPRESAKQEAIFHQQCRDEGVDPHAGWVGRPCVSCLGVPA